MSSIWSRMLPNTYILEPVIAKLREKLKETNNREPCTPHHNFIHLLGIQNTKNEYKLVEYKVPELVLDVLWKKI